MKKALVAFVVSVIAAGILALIPPAKNDIELGKISLSNLAQASKAPGNFQIPVDALELKDYAEKNQLIINLYLSVIPVSVSTEAYVKLQDVQANTGLYEIKKSPVFLVSKQNFGSAYGLFTKRSVKMMPNGTVVDYNPEKSYYPSILILAVGSFVAILLIPIRKSSQGKRRKKFENPTILS